MTDSAARQALFYTVEEYFGLVERGLLHVASAPGPDLAVVPGWPEDFDERHPDRAVLVIEVAATSLPQDRLTKQALYAVAGIPEYWIVNLLDRAVEVLRTPSGRAYA